MLRPSLKDPRTLIVILILIVVVMAPIDYHIQNSIPPQDPEEISSLPIGSTVVSGMQVADPAKIRKEPLIIHPDYLIENIEDRDIGAVIYGLFTGTMMTPIKEITEGVEVGGRASQFEGPGMLTIKGDQLVVQPPADFIWAYKTPYTYAIKTKDGIAIMQKNKTIKTVSPEGIGNIHSDYINTTELKEWYNESKVGDRIPIDFSLSNFSDGRLEVPPDQITRFFGENTKKYMEQYPAGTPIMAYMRHYKVEEIATATSQLESFPEYDDINREYNAREFVKAWNGTIVPPGTSSSGKDTVQFTSSRDPKAPGGYASHGTCPPARALRDAVAKAGLPTPTGISWGYFALIYGFDPATDVKVYNDGKYPIMIIMWTEGSGPSMVIYAKILRLIPT
ncbi:hypothetical protein [Methanothermobacter tenebrarum]|uniref:Uncharacterized protein n=1 Tax=Methanothermobacter tenebrarum TaxID=680118 RepID=A0A328P9J4_9EURY|nr:hypothetical protein [Methanothermobacter tenebrarum]NPV64416.1 hypothetical protein [Methanobacteriaceae archaeon]RAO78809.1 hypothetical protein DPC56_06010 [Methanothermobacter tenebrarum]